MDDAKTYWVIILCGVAVVLVCFAFAMLDGAQIAIADAATRQATPR